MSHPAAGHPEDNQALQAPPRTIANMGLTKGIDGIEILANRTLCAHSWSPLHLLLRDTSRGSRLLTSWKTCTDEAMLQRPIATPCRGLRSIQQSEVKPLPLAPVKTEDPRPPLPTMKVELEKLLGPELFDLAERWLQVMECGHFHAVWDLFKPWDFQKLLRSFEGISSIRILTRHWMHVFGKMILAHLSALSFILTGLPKMGKRPLR